MKTKYILHGGMPSVANEENDKFFQAMVKDAPDSVNILLIYFHKTSAEIKERLPQLEEKFQAQAKHKKLSFTIATLEDLEKQIKQSDIIYMPGGNSLKLINPLMPYKTKLNKLFQGKIVAGSSAGACAISSYYYDNDYNKIYPGLALLPITTRTHYKSQAFLNDENMAGKLDKYKPKLELIKLKEFETKIIYK